jgi:hypothetical protein
MATGKEIMDVFESADYAHLMADFTETAINLGIETPETILVAQYLLWRDMDFIGSCNSGEELEKVVLDSAQNRGQYAGLYYEEEDFEEDSCPDDGLSWVGFGDMWEIFETMLTLPKYEV